MFLVLSLTVFALLLARLLRAPAGTWRYVVAGAAVVIAASQALPADNAFRASIAASVRPMLWLVVAAVPVAAYGALLRRVRRRTGADSLGAPLRRHPVGVVRIDADDALSAETLAALDRETATVADAAPARLSLGWRAGDGSMAGHLRLSRLAATAEIEALWVVPAERRRGIGARLLAAAEGEARMQGARRMTAAPGSWQAPGFFEAAGYVTILERPLGGTLSRRWMEKELR